MYWLIFSIPLRGSEVQYNICGINADNLCRQFMCSEEDPVQTTTSVLVACEMLGRYFKTFSTVAHVIA